VDDIGLEIFYKRNEAPVRHPGVAVPADADAGELMRCPEVRCPDRPASRDVECVSDVQIDVSP
jgi:hypothetical protein